jgi:hypothetical protein
MLYSRHRRPHQLGSGHHFSMRTFRCSHLGWNRLISLFGSAEFDNDVAPHVQATQKNHPLEFKGGESSNYALTLKP